MREAGDATWANTTWMVDSKASASAGLTIVWVYLDTHCCSLNNLPSQIITNATLSKMQMPLWLQLSSNPMDNVALHESEGLTFVGTSHHRYSDRCHPSPWWWSQIAYTLLWVQSIPALAQSTMLCSGLTFFFPLYFPTLWTAYLSFLTILWSVYDSFLVAYILGFPFDSLWLPMTYY